MIDSTLTVKDSLVIQKGARVKDVLTVDGDVILKSNLLIKKDFKVNGNSILKGDVVIKEGNLKIKSIADTSLPGNGVLMINSNGKVVNGGDLRNLLYSLTYLNEGCALDMNGGIIPAPPFWQADPNRMFLLNGQCSRDVKLGVGIKPTAKFHILIERFSTTLPILVEKATVGNQPAYKLLQLDNNGVLSAREVKVDLDVWPDYVFKKEYELKPIYELKSFINQHGHLPNVPTAQEIESNGVNLGDMAKITMEKVEELTLYLIKLQEVVDKQQQQLAEQQKLIEKQQQQINALLK